MKAMILAAGLGTRLKPWTLSHPKALVPVEGEPMLRRVMMKLKGEGFDRITVNVHHFASQIEDYLRDNDFGVEVAVSDERERLLDTGGALLHAREKLFGEPGPVLIHNVDILSDADLGGLMRHHEESGADCTLLVSDRESSRRLIFSRDMRLKGWRNLNDGSYKPAGFVAGADDREYAFSGIYVVGEAVVDRMAAVCGDAAFPIIDFLLANIESLKIEGVMATGLRLIDIGKPATLSQAHEFFND